MRLLAFDPGLTGGHAQFHRNKLIFAGMMPTRRIETKPKREVLDLKDGKKQYYKTGSKKDQVKMKLKSPAKYKKELDTKAIYDLMQNATHIVIERQNPRPGNAAASSFTTGTNYGKLLACAELSGAEVILVTPGVWKKHYKLALTPKEKKSMTDSAYKKMSIKKAYELTEWNTSYDGIADAICIGSYVIETMKGTK